MIGIYARVSTEDQAKKGYSLKDQVRECREKSKSNQIIEYIDEGISGAYIDRPALNKLRDDIKSGLIDEVICLQPDRLSRDATILLVVAQEISKRAKLSFANTEYENTPEGKLLFQIMGIVSEFEKAKINERMTRGRKQKARQGKIVKNYFIYGYDYNKEIGKLIINEDEARSVRLIFTLFTEKSSQQGINGIAKYLTNNNIPTKRGASSWHRQVVRQILMNETYIGFFYQNRWNTEGMLGNKYDNKNDKIPLTIRPKEEWILIESPKIIEKEQFDYAQKLLTVSRQRWSGTSKHDYLLSGLVKCNKCNNTMTGRRVKNWSKYTYEYTDIKNTAGAKNRGCGNRIKAEKLEESIWDSLVNYFNQTENINITNGEGDNGETLSIEEMELIRIDKKLIKIKNGRQNLINLLALGTTMDDLLLTETKEKLTSLFNEEVKLKEQQEEIKSAQNMNNQDESRVIRLQETLDWYNKTAPEEITHKDKKQIIRYLVKEIRVDDNDVADIVLF